MTDFLDSISRLSPKRLALLALELHDKLEHAEKTAREPVAVIGMACRFPGGADDPDSFWDLLESGRDAIVEVPKDRWNIEDWFHPDPDEPSRMSVRNGGFLDDVSGFDAAFFGVAPREALTMDPQHRLLLETSWRALENAGATLERVAGSPTGVFVGICNSDHFQRVLGRGIEKVDAYLASGNAHSVAAGRIAYCLGLQGPAIAVDTACSSSLVALHLACQSVRRGESRMALAAGVNLMCSPEVTVALTKAHMLAPDGRCKTFDASADGFSRGEGCGVLVLKRLSDALSDGDRVLAVIRGTAANQDGRSGGLTVPNGPAQEAVIAAALADGGLAPPDIDYVEAHGTGTSLGDPIEVRALAGALCRARSAELPLLIGSVKTNIGHLESAAGIAGVIKVVLSLQKESIPPQLHFRTPSPHIGWSEHPIQVVAQGRRWPRGDRVRRAGVSSFGFSGTNAHVIIEEAPPVAAECPGATRPLQILPLSARTPAALAATAGLYAARLGESGGSDRFVSFAQTAAVGRSQFDERLVVVAADAAEARLQCLRAASGDPRAELIRGTVRGQPPEVVFLFTGQGAQYPGMAERLYRDAPVFRDIIDRCDSALGADGAGRTLKQVMFQADASADRTAPIHDTAWTQPALFALEYGLAQLWRSWGIEPAAVIGHSVGEYVAACVAGVFGLEEGLQLIAARGGLMQALAAGGTMAAVFASAEVLAEEIAGHPELSIAAVNAPDNVVVSGDAQAVDLLLARLAQREIEGQRLLVSLAAHSSRVEPVLDQMESLARATPMRAPRLPVAWNLTGGGLPEDCTDDGVTPNAVYWRRHMRETVLFAEGIERLHEDGYHCFLEVGPHPVLLALAQRSLPDTGVSLVHSLRRGRDDWREILGSLGRLWVEGASVDWQGVERPYLRPRIDIPGYPFERRPYWIVPPAAAPAWHALPSSTPLDGSGPALLGRRLPVASPTFELRLTPRSPAYLADHRLHGAVLVAGPVFLEMAQVAAAALDANVSRRFSVAQFRIHEPLVLNDSGRLVQIQLQPCTESDGLRFFIHSLDARQTDEGDGGSAAGTWRMHASGRLEANAEGTSIAEYSDDSDWNAPVPGARYYDRLADLGIELGERFRSLQSLYRHATNPGRVRVSMLQPPIDVERERPGWASPALLDGALQAAGFALCDGPLASSNDVYLFTGFDRLELEAPLPETLIAEARLRDSHEPSPEKVADIRLCDPAGRLLGRIDGVTLRHASAGALRRIVRASDGVPAEPAQPPWRYEVRWEASLSADGSDAASSLVAPSAYAAAIRRRFEELAAAHQASVYGRLLPELDRLSADHVMTAMRRLGFRDIIGRVFDPQSEASILGVRDRHRRLFARLMEILVAAGTLRRAEGRYVVAAPLAADDPALRYDALLRGFEDVSGELKMLRRCGERLDAVLTGRQDPLQLLFPDGSFAEAKALYFDSPYARTYNGTLAEAVQAAVAGLSGRRVRILEIGAGTGGTSSRVLPVLPATATYHFTDVSPLFLERAADLFSGFPFVEFRRLDIEQEPVGQGFDAASYDIIIAANVLHATADLRRTLGHVRDLLAPGGQLMLLEGGAPEAWVDLTFGLTEGWWRFTDTELRPDYALISPATWGRLLESGGFEDVVEVPGTGEQRRGLAQQSFFVAKKPVASRHWTLIDGGGLDAEIAKEAERRLIARGQRVTRCSHRDAAASGELTEGTDVWVYLGASGADVEHGRAAGEASHAAVTAPMDGLSSLTRGGRGKAWLVTRGAQPACDRVAPDGRFQAQLWGIGRVFALEEPGRWGGLVDLDPDVHDAASLAETLVAAIDHEDEEDQSAWRAGARYVPRLRSMPDSARPLEPLRLDGNATYLVTGAFGGLGPLIADWLFSLGARHLALVGRHADSLHPVAQALTARGAIVYALRADVSDATAMAQEMRELAVRAPRVRGIVHAAASLSSGRIGQLEHSQIEAMLRPKVDGTLFLQRFAREADADFLVLFSSSTALLGAAGFAHYAAANLFMDATAYAERRAGRPVLSVNWGTWERMRVASEQDKRMFVEAGLRPMASPTAFRALETLIMDGVSQAMVADVDWPTLKALHELRRSRPLLRDLGRSELRPVSDSTMQTTSAAAAQTPAAGPRSGIVQRYEEAPPDLRHELLIGLAQAEVAAVLGAADASSIPRAKGLFDLGMDSLMAVELRRRFERALQMPLPSTLTFNHPNVDALARYFGTALMRRLASVPQAAAADVEDLRTEAVPTGETGRANAAARLDSSLDELSDDELEAQLLARLDQIR